jgi:hypothetical protein
MLWWGELAMSRLAASSRSYEKVNYLLRPRKQIERKILIEILKNVRSIDSYHYVGLGSIFYYDFILFHKYLNVTNMTSLDCEKEVSRFDFNRPYDFVTFVNKTTTEFLSEYDFAERTLMWFDYDSMLYDPKTQSPNDSILNDIQIVTRRATPKTLFFITIDIGPPQVLQQQDAFRSAFGHLLPSKYKTELYRVNNARFLLRYRYMIQEIILNFIEEESKFRRAKFHKLFSFYYRDTAPMYTIGGIYDDTKGFRETQSLIASNEFISSRSNQITDIDVPILTYKEKIHLDRKVRWLQRRIAKGKGKGELQRIMQQLKFEIRPPSMLQKYLRFYRYYPQYYEGII